MDESFEVDLVQLTAEIVSANVSANKVAISDLPGLIKSVHDALAALGKPSEPTVDKPKGAVSSRASIKPDGLISMIDGKKYQTLRRHITRNGYTPESYRETFGLPRDYPMTSAAYSERRRVMARSIGLGRAAVAASAVAAVAVAAVAATAPAKSVRRPRAPKADTTGTAAPMALVEAAKETAPAPKRRTGPLKLKLGSTPESGT